MICLRYMPSSKELHVDEKEKKQQQQEALLTPNTPNNKLKTYTYDIHFKTTTVVIPDLGQTPKYLTRVTYC